MSNATADATDLNASQCQRLAAGFQSLDPQSALFIYIFFLTFIDPLLVSLTATFSSVAQGHVVVTPTTLPTTTTTTARAKEKQRKEQSKVEKCFIVTTLGMMAHVVELTVLGLSVQVTYWCAPNDEVVTEGGYIAMWIVLVLVAGGYLATSTLGWWKAALAVRGRKTEVKWYAVLEWELIVLLSPFIFMAVLVLMLVKGGGREGERAGYQDWWIVRRWKSLGRSIGSGSARVTAGLKKVRLSSRRNEIGTTQQDNDSVEGGDSEKGDAVVSLQRPSQGV